MGNTFTNTALARPTVSFGRKVKDIILDAVDNYTNGSFIYVDPADLDVCQDPDSSKCPSGCTHTAYNNDSSSRLCGSCAVGFSRGTNGKCDRCPSSAQNMWLAVFGIFVGSIVMFVIVQITLSDQGDVSGADGIKLIFISFLQMLSIVKTFPIEWPAPFSALLNAAGAIVVIGEHLVNFKCFFPKESDAEAFYRQKIMWSLLPVFLGFLIVILWYLLNCCGKKCLSGRYLMEPLEQLENEESADEIIQVGVVVPSHCKPGQTLQLMIKSKPYTIIVPVGSQPNQTLMVEVRVPRIPTRRNSSSNGTIQKWCMQCCRGMLRRNCLPVSNINEKVKVSVVAILFLLHPSLCENVFALWSCRSVCGGQELYLIVDLKEQCWEGRHMMYFFALGLPMLLLYVVGLPISALIGIYNLRKNIEHHRVVTSTTTVAETINFEEKIDVDNKDKENRFITGTTVATDLDITTLPDSMATLPGLPDSMASNFRVLGVFYSIYRPQYWWWESTVVVRKIGIAIIGVFGSFLGDMQLHISILGIVLFILATALAQPFSETRDASSTLLQLLELLSLIFTFFVLWAGSVFKSYPFCKFKTGTIEYLRTGGASSEPLPWCVTISWIVIVGVCVSITTIGYYFVVAKNILPSCCCCSSCSKRTKEAVKETVTTRASTLQDGNLEMVRVSDLTGRTEDEVII